jgi:valyl-tRNA synthetase
MTAAELASLPLAERYIVSRCHELTGSVTASLASYSMGAAGTDIARFLWDEYADWYIEASKTRFQRATAAEAEGAADAAQAAAEAAAARRTLVYVLDSGVRLLHPFMPYVTEAIWQRLPHEGETLMNARWPQMAGAPALPVDEGALAMFASFQVRAAAAGGAQRARRGGAVLGPGPMAG